MKVSEISDPSKTVLEISNMIKKKKKRPLKYTDPNLRRNLFFPFV